MTICYLYSKLNRQVNGIDIVLGIFLLIGLIQGFRKGLIVELASLAGLVLGVFGAVHFSYIVANWLIDYTNWNEQTIQLVAFAITFVGILILVSLLAKAVTKLIGLIALGMINRLLGAVFGVLKIAFITSVILFFINSWMPTYNAFLSEEKKEASLLYTPIEMLAPMILPSFTKEFKDVIPSEGALEIKSSS